MGDFLYPFRAYYLADKKLFKCYAWAIFIEIIHNIEVNPPERRIDNHTTNECYKRGQSQISSLLLSSQSRVETSTSDSPWAPCGGRWRWHALMIWSAVCSSSPHSQTGLWARPHLCMLALKRPTPVRRRLSFTHAWRGRSEPGLLLDVSGT